MPQNTPRLLLAVVALAFLVTGYSLNVSGYSEQNTAPAIADSQDLFARKGEWVINKNTPKYLCGLATGSTAAFEIFIIDGDSRAEVKILRHSGEQVAPAQGFAWNPGDVVYVELEGADQYRIETNASNDIKLLIRRVSSVITVSQK